MAWSGPSDSFRVFEGEANGFKIRPDHSEMRFDAKQRMISRAEGFAIREAYLIPWWRLFTFGPSKSFREGVERCDGRLASAGEDTENPELKERDDERHRAEICLDLYARTVQQIILRRLYFVSAVAAVGAFVAAVVAVVVTVFK